MSSLRIVFATRRFWPQADWPETNMARLAVGLTRRGVRVIVVAGHWAVNMPARTSFHGIPVIRLPSPSPGMWGTMRYVTALRHWLRAHRSEIDLVCASRMRFDAYAALRAWKNRTVPVVLRADAEDVSWQQHTVFGRSIRHGCLSADAIVAPSLVVQRELQAAGYPPERIHVIHNGVPAVRSRGGGDRFDTRLGLAASNPDLTVANDEAVVAFGGRLCKGNGLPCLLRAWRIVASYRPGARLWLIGDGPLRGELYRLAGDLDLRQQVCMPGSCESLQDVFSAVNAVVQPAARADLSQTALEAIAAGVPVIVAHNAGIPVYPELDGEHASLAKSRPDDLADAILKTLNHPPSKAALDVARRRVLVQHSLLAMARQHLTLFQKMHRGKCRGF